MAEPLDGSLADAELAAFIAAGRQDPGPPARAVGAAELRRAQRVRVAARPRGPEMARVEELTVGTTGVPARCYRPADTVRALVVFLHGGMWTIGDLDSHDRACRRLARATGAAVLSVDFRRAPEHPWPAAVDDCVDVVRWVAAGGTSRAGIEGPTAVMGDSSGGNLAALACLRLRDEGGPLPAAQVLAYPNTDLTLSHPSARTMATGWGLASDDVAWGAEQWVPDPARRADPGVSPVFAPDLAGLPPAVVVTAEHDPLRDEGEAYAARLAAAGVPVRHRREAGMIHGFLTLDTVSPAAAAAGDRLHADVADLLAHLR
ncbi:alpha/beta hydrolase fold domain-containing protein [Micromonospora terminaliae]|uniref:Alpha/beta hydrolase n=1 Tax=Micromonospora terminaliae TaxID=1914461 RepID=A0AAJ2ZA69_9ACTN|nr:alpha/beta hydrolase [Micromonospora terminaliae]NES26337.1 alpha/beta hydrolase [Micromonospora terminaliae]QGL50517.1 alpha/beta hydrolase fold domain-containing protein [Micromonospora terminaliae]